MQSLQEKNGLKRGEDGLKAEFFNFQKVLKSETDFFSRGLMDINCPQSSSVYITYKLSILYIIIQH